MQDVGSWDVPFGGVILADENAGAGAPGAALLGHAVVHDDKHPFRQGRLLRHTARGGQ